MAHTTCSNILGIVAHDDHIVDAMVHALGIAIYNNNRKCYKCGREMTWNDFTITFSVFKSKNPDFPLTAKEIWDNDIFVLKCCSCYHHGHIILRDPAVWYIEENYEGEK